MFKWICGVFKADPTEISEIVFTEKDFYLSFNLTLLQQKNMFLQYFGDIVIYIDSQTAINR